MRGKKPKEREKYVIRLDDGTLVEVAREIYLEWYRSKRKERYQRERDRKYGLCSIERLCEKGYFPGQSVCNVDKTLETILHNECLDKLENALKNLSEQDIRLVRFLYFEETDGKDFIAYYKKRVLIIRLAFEQYLLKNPDVKEGLANGECRQGKNKA